MSDNPTWVGWRSCPHCGKHTYRTRGEARRFRRRQHRSDRQFNAYQACDGDGFHLGHSNALQRALKEKRSK